MSVRALALFRATYVLLIAAITIIRASIVMLVFDICHDRLMSRAVSYDI